MRIVAVTAPNQGLVGRAQSTWSNKANGVRLTLFAGFLTSRTPSLSPPFISNPTVHIQNGPLDVAGPSSGYHSGPRVHPCKWHPCPYCPLLLPHHKSPFWSFPLYCSNFQNTTGLNGKKFKIFVFLFIFNFENKKNTPYI